MKNFFSAVKSLDEYLDFLFITGVSSFTKSGVFSGMNNLMMITLEPEFAAVCGYTDEEVDACFAPYIKEWAKKEKISYGTLREQIRAWYDGYHFGEDTPAIYNPFSLVKALLAKRFQNFLFTTGTPSFLIEELKKEQRRQECEIFDLEQLKASQDFLESSDVNEISLPTLLFQTGYLTIDSYDVEAESYNLKFPNLEVRTSLLKRLLCMFANVEPNVANYLTSKLKPLLIKKDIEGAVNQLKKIFSNVPAQLHMEREQFYHALLQVACMAAGIKTQAEYNTSQGRIDLVLELPDVFYIIEVKYNGSAKSALAQIEKQKYYEPFLDNKKSIWLIGLAFKRHAKKKKGSSQFELTYVCKHHI